MHRHRRAYASFAFVVLLAVVVSCLQGPKAPQVRATRTLDISTGEPGGVTSAKPFGVVFAGPTGKTVDPSEVTLVFNRPMRALELAGEESQPPASIAIKGTSPPRAPKGSWRWMGTSALIFAPDPRLPRATEYVVTVPPGTKALDGSVMEKAYSFELSTPPPVLVRIDPPEGNQHLVPSSKFELRFNQPVEPKEVERAAKLFVGAVDGKDAKDGKSVAFTASRPRSDTPMLVKVTPSAPLPLASTVTLVVDASLHGTEGPLPLGAERKVSLATYGPLEVEGMECSTSTPHRKCAAGGYLSLHLSNRAAYASLKAHVRVKGAAVHWSETRGGDAMVAWAGVDATLKPARSYAIVVTAGLKDEYGQTLAHDVTLPFETDDEWPSLAIGVSGSVYESAPAAGGEGAAVAKKTKAREAPIGSVNVPAFDLVTASLDEAQVAAMTTGAYASPRAQFDRAAETRGAKRETVRPGAPANATAVRTVRLDDLLAKSGGHGAALVAVRHETGSRKSSDTRVLAVTDLGISAKMSRFGSVVWITRLSDGAPVAGATVTVRSSSHVITSVTTDASGLATIAASAYVPVDEHGSEDRDAILVARAGTDWTWRPVSDALSPWEYAPSSDTSGRLVPMGMLFTDRGIYKTGESVRVKGMFRTPLARGTATPKGRAVTLEAYDSAGSKVHEESATLDAFGAFASDVAIPASARLGTLELRAELAAQGDSPQGTATATAQLAAYRPAEFKVAVEPDRSSYVRGDKASFVTRGDYLYGAPMSGGDVRFTVTRGPTSFAPPGTEGLVVDDDPYVWGLPDDSPRAGEIQSGDGALDAKGTFGAAASLALPHQRGPEVVSFESEVTDVSRQAIAGRASVVVHPADFYVAMRTPKDLFVARGTALKPAVVAVDPKGARRAGVRVKIELVKRAWQSVVEASGEYGHATSSVVDTPVGSCEVTTAAELASCDLTAAQAGYFLLRATSKDRRGNAVAASAPMYVLGEGEGVGWRLDDTSKLELVTDKKTYEVGDVARVLVKSPFAEADALITVERAGVYKQERQTLTGAMPTLSIPITGDMRPNAFVSVHLVRGRTKDAPATGADVGAPAFRLGYAELVVNPEARRLKVAIAPARKDLRPGDDVDADIVVTDRAGRGVKAEVTFYAVDEGVLMLTGYKTPDPIPVFTAPRPLNVFSIENRESLAKILLHANGVGIDKGDEGGGGGGIRADFRSTAYFEPSLVTDANGKAHVKFKLPDSLTTYRLMAVAAAEDDRFGLGDSQVVVSRPLMARPNLPRFLRAGDEIEAGVVLSSKGMGAQSVAITIDAKGLALRGDAKRVVALPANGNVEVRWALSAPVAGKATIAFHATAGAEKDDVVVTREVEVPLSMETVALYGETTSAVAEKIGDTASMRPDVGGLDVRLASSALVGLDDGVEQLIEYPYGCTEQLTSRLVPLVPLRQLAADYHIALPANLAQVIDQTVAKVVQNQRDDGGFGWWPDSERSDPWVSAYALWGLDIAKKGGAYLPDETLEKGTRYLHDRIPELLNAQLVGHATAAFYLDVLAALGSPDPGYASRLYDARAKLPLFARALLAHAMATSKMDRGQATELTRDFESHLRITPTGATVVENLGDEYAVVLDSEARTTAMVMRALLAIDPNHALAARLAKGLLGARKAGTWRSTQETAWALLALDDYRRAQERGTPDFDAQVFFGDALVLQAPFRTKSTMGQTASVAAAKLTSQGSGAALAFQVEGSGKLFYEARLHYAKKELPRDGIDRGFFVRKLVRSVRPAALKDALATLPATSATGAGAGEMVLVDLIVVTADPREQVVIDDPLPAGLEAVQASLATTARSLDVVESGGAGDRMDEDASDDDAVASGRAWNGGAGEAWYHREYRDDRVLTFVDHMPAGMFHYRYLARATTYGRFVVPPTRAECMYEPETFGRTGATTFEVKAR